MVTLQAGRIERSMRAASVADAAVSRVCTAIAENGLAIEPEFLGAPVVRGLAAEARRRDAAGEFHAARVGRGRERVERRNVRGDRTAWLDQRSNMPAEVALRAALEELRVALNQAQFLGLLSFEGHYAIYPPGAFYRRHRDRFRDDDGRVLSCVLYLNEAWTRADGGALRIHLGGGEALDVLPTGGTLVCFLAERYEHEVLPTTRERLAVTGWFLRRQPRIGQFSSAPARA
jgi:SM-20-related protein